MNDEMITKRMAEIRARLEAATPGPWHLERKERLVTTTATIVHGPNYQRPNDLGPVAFVTTPNAELVAHAPADLAYLLDGLLAMKAQRDAARAALNLYNLEVNDER